MEKPHWKETTFEITITVDNGSYDPVVLSYKDWKDWKDIGIKSISDYIEGELKSYVEDLKHPPA